MDCVIRVSRNDELFGFVRIDDGWVSDTWHAEPHWPLKVGRIGQGDWSHYSSTTTIWLWEKRDDGTQTIVCDLLQAKHPLRLGDRGPGVLHASRPTLPQYADIKWEIVEAE